MSRSRSTLAWAVLLLAVLVSAAATLLPLPTVTPTAHAARGLAPYTAPAAPTFPTTGTVKSNANLRAGPGTSYAKAATVTAGQKITLTAANPKGDWLQLDNGAWIAAFLVNLHAGSAAPTRAPTTPKTAVPQGAVPAEVVYIVDGDTIHVKIDGVEYKLRYIVMNTPEVDQPFGTEATAANRRLVQGTTVYLVKDVSETDRYGRLLRYVYLPDGTFVNAELVRQGLAQLATFPPDVAKEAEIRAAQQEAIAAGRGLWAEGAAAPASAPAAAPAATPAPLKPASRTGAVAPLSGAGGGLKIVAVNKRAEYVDIRHDGSATVELSGWVLRSEKGMQDCKLGGSIAPGDTLRIYAMTGANGFNCGYGKEIWNNSQSDPAVLLAPGGKEVDRY